MLNLVKMTIHNFVYLHRIVKEFDPKKDVFFYGENRDSDVATSNGTGKSLIPDALYWVLFDILIRGSGKDSVVGPNDDHTYVITRWKDSVSKKEYEIARYRDHPEFKNSATIGYVSGKKVSLLSKATKKTNEKICELFGVSHIVARNSSFFTDNPDRFVSSKDSLREDLFLKILELDDKIRNAKKKSLKDYKDFEEKKDKIERCIGVDEGDISGLKERLLSLEKYISIQKFAVIRSSEEEVRALQEKLDEKIEAISVCNAELYDLIYSIAIVRNAILDVGDKITKTEEHLYYYSGEKSRFAAKMESIAKDLSMCRSLIKKLQGGSSSVIGKECRECGKIIGKKDVESYIIRLSEKEKRLLEAKVLLKKEYEKFSFKSEKYEKTHLSLAKKLDKLRTKKAPMSERSKFLTGRIEYLESFARGVTESIENFNFDKKNDILEGFLRDKKEVEKKIKDLDISLFDSRCRLDYYKRELDIASFWKKLFGRGVFRDAIVKEKIAELSDLATMFLEELTDGNYTISISQNKEGSVRRIPINVRDNNGKGNIREYWSCSKGEKVRVRLSVGAAFGEMCYSNLGLLVFDEDLDGLDKRGLDRVFEIVKAKFEGRQVFLFSHDENIVSGFGENVKLIRENNKTMIA